MDPTSSYGNLISFKSLSEGPCQALSETQAHFISWIESLLMYSKNFF